MSSARILKNTLLLYFRMIFVMGVSLYASRVILAALGVDDFGVYNVIGGIVTLLAFLNSSMSGATARFLTAELGKHELGNPGKVFLEAKRIHLGISIILLLLAETGGLWFLKAKIVIPAGREDAAFFVYQISVITGCIGVVMVPYSSLIIAHEKMNIFAFVGVAESALRLVLVFFLRQSPFDKLLTFSVIILFLTLFSSLLQWAYCYYKLPESQTKGSVAVRDVIPMIKFSGVDLIGNLSILMRTQGVNVLLNIFLGPAVNAANAVAVQVQNAVTTFAENFLTAVRPQIIKRFVAADQSDLILLVMRTSILSFSMLYVIALPFLAMTKMLLVLWLGTPPAYAALLCQLVIANSLISVMFRPFMFVIHASGKIWGLSVVNGAIYLLVLPISYFFLREGYGPEVPFVVNLVLLVVGSILNIVRVSRLLPEFAMSQFLRGVLAPATLIVLFTATPVFFLENATESRGTLVQIFLVSGLSIPITALCAFIFGLQRTDKIALIDFVRRRLQNA